MEVSRRSFLTLLGISPVSLQLFGRFYEPQITVYKIVTLRDNLIFGKCSHAQYRVTYKINEFTYPKVGKLFAYKELQSALQYTRDIHSIYKCKATNVIKAYHHPAVDYNSIPDFWNGEPISYYALYNPHEGALFCDSIKLVEKII